jgi:pilus assembly protein FimV
MESLGEMDFSQMSDEDNDDIFDNSGDMVGTKLDLAKAYIDMGDQDGARSILDEVVGEGDDDQRQEAEQLKQQIS